jgi:hypothetical protein
MRKVGLGKGDKIGWGFADCWCRAMSWNLLFKNDLRNIDK